MNLAKIMIQQNNGNQYLQKIVKSLLYVIFIYSIFVVLEYARQGFINDLSLQKPYHNSLDLHENPVYLISYADGQDVIYRNQNALNQCAINKGVDFILNYKRNLLSAEFLESNKEIMQNKVGAGLWLWKPYIILETMNRAQDGAIIIYTDSAFCATKPLDGLIDMLGEDNDVLLVHDRNRKNGAFVKGDSFALTNCLSEECRNAPLIMSGIIAVRNSVISRKFIEKWLETAKDIRILSHENYGILPNYPEYQWHHFDQSVLSLIYYQNPKSVKMIEHKDTVEILAWFHRKDTDSAPFKSWYTVYGINPLINFSTFGKALPSTALLNTPPVVRLRKKLIEIIDF